MPKEGDFMEAPHYHPTKNYLTDLGNLIYFPSIPIDRFDKAEIAGASPALFKMASSALNNAHYQLYQLRVVKRYFGEEFLHGFTTNYDSSANLIQFCNLDDTPQSYQYTKELTRALAGIMATFLDKYDYYILYMGQQEAITFVDKDFLLENNRKLLMQGRIAWYR